MEDTAGVDLPALVCRSASRATSLGVAHDVPMISGAQNGRVQEPWITSLRSGQRAGQRDPVC